MKNTMKNTMKNVLNKVATSKVVRFAKRLKWRNIAIIAFSITICITAIHTIKPIYVPDSGTKEREEMSSFYRQQDVDSTLAEARKEHDAEQIAIDKKNYEDVSSIWEAQQQEEYYKFANAKYSNIVDLENDNDSEVSNTKVSLNESEINMLTQFVQSEAKIFEGTPYCDTTMQYVAATIVNRIGKDGFGPNMAKANSLYDVLSNTSQYKNVLSSLDRFDPYDETARKNVLAVLNHNVSTPDNLYYEDCSAIYNVDFDAVKSYIDNEGILRWSYAEAKADAERVFASHYPDAKEFKVCYSAFSKEGRFLMFGTNPYGAYAY